MFNTLHQKGFEAFKAMDLPTDEREDWRYTRLEPLAKLSFGLSKTDKPIPWATSSFIESKAFSPHELRLVFLNGRLGESFSTLSPYVQPLSAAIRQHADLVKSHLGRYVEVEDQWGIALNTAFFQEGVFIYLPKDCVLTSPIHLYFISEGSDQVTVSHPRILIVAEENSQATVIEHYLGRARYFTNAVTEIAEGEGAKIYHYKLQEEDEQSFHLATLKVSQGKQSHLTSYSISLGSILCRNEIQTVLDGEGAESILNGLYLAKDHQHVDYQTSIDHVKPHATSSETYKGILSGHAQGVFNGRIIVRPGAVQTVAKQLNKNLLLSDEAIVNTKPLLEILNNDVKCNHGATIGRLDEAQLFYLRSRGVGYEEARRLLILAFASDLLEGIPERGLREKFKSLVGRELQ